MGRGWIDGNTPIEQLRGTIDVLNDVAKDLEREISAKDDQIKDQADTIERLEAHIKELEQDIENLQKEEA